MRILTVNNSSDEKFLRTPTTAVDFSRLSEKEINQLLKDMRQSMLQAEGIGLSANQVGLSLRFFIAETENREGHRHFYAVFNPRLDKASEEKSKDVEGCLSIPDLAGVVERPEKISVSGQNRYGKPVKFKLNGLVARVFQHEMDHLDGILFTDRAKKTIKISELLNKNSRVEIKI